MIASYRAKVIARPHIKYLLRFEGEASVKVKVGDRVVPSTVIFEGNESVVLESFNMCRELAVTPEQVIKYLNMADGEIIDRGDVVARRFVAVGTVERVVKAQRAGRVSYARVQSGIIDILSPFAEAEVEAGVHGKVLFVYPEQGHHRDVVFDVTAYTASVFESVGDEMSGEIRIMKDGLSIYRPCDADSSYRGKIVIAGRSLSVALYDALVEAGARGIIVGGMQKSEFGALKNPAVPIAVTEGWGIIPINSVLMSVFREHEGDVAFLTPREGFVAVCPSDVIPEVEGRGFVSETETAVAEVQKGQHVQIWDLPYWGFCGTVVNTMETDGLVQIAIGGENKILIDVRSIDIIGEE